MTTDDLSELMLDNKAQLKTLEQKKKKGGRRKKKDEDKTKMRVTVYFTEAEYSSIMKSAGRIPLSVYVKMILEKDGHI